MAAPIGEVRSRLVSVVDVCESELAAIEELGDDRFELITATMHRFCVDLLEALAGLQRIAERDLAP